VQFIKYFYSVLLVFLLSVSFLIGFEPKTVGVNAADSAPLPVQEAASSSTAPDPAPAVSEPAPAPRIVAKPTPVTETTSQRVQTSAAPSRSASDTRPTGLIATAKKCIGVKYVWGGTTPSGFDCSGFTQYVFAQNDISLPRVSRDQFNTGNAVDFSNLQPNDLVFFSMDGDKVTDHVGIYIGNGQFIHASSSKGVTVSSFSSYWNSKYLGARKVI